MECDVTWLRELVRHVPDFPEPGIRFADISPVLANPDALRCAVELIADEFVGQDVDVIAGIDARGFIFGAPVACRLGCGFVPVRKPNKLPGPTHNVEYSLEYGTNSLEIQQDACRAGQRVVIIDDVLATGGTAKASIELIESTGASVAALGFLASIEGLDGAAQLPGHDPVVVLGAI